MNSSYTLSFGLSSDTGSIPCRTSPKRCSAQGHTARVWAPGTQHRSAVDRPGGAGQTGLIGQLLVTSGYCRWWIPNLTDTGAHTSLQNVLQLHLCTHGHIRAYCYNLYALHLITLYFWLFTRLGFDHMVHLPTTCYFGWLHPQSRSVRCFSELHLRQSWGSQCSSICYELEAV